MFFSYSALILSGVLCVLLFWGLIYTLRINRARRNRFSWSYLAPVILVVLLVFVICLEFRPRLLDLIATSPEALQSYTVNVENAEIKGPYLMTRGRRFLLGPDQRNLDLSKDWRISVSPYAGVVINVTEVLPPDESKGSSVTP